MGTSLLSSVRRGRCRVGPEKILEYDLVYVTDPAQIPTVRAWVAEQTKIGLDIETDGRSPDGLKYQSKKIATIQIGNPTGPNPRVYVICVRSVGDAIIPLLQDVADRRIAKLGQNIRFELQWIAYKWGILVKNVADCQVAELVIRAGLFPITKNRSEDGAPSRKCYSETSMFKLGVRYLEIEMDKGADVRLEFWNTPPGKLNMPQLLYAASDVIYPFYLLEEQKKEIRGRGLGNTVRLEFELIPTLVDSELFGIGLDVKQWNALYQEALTDRAAAKKALDALFRPQSEQEDLFTDRRSSQDPNGLLEVEPDRGEIRPTLGSKEINYDAPEQVKRAIVQYCKVKRWPVEVVTTWPRLVALKKLYGESWLARNPDKEVRDVPESFIPEKDYVIILNLLGDTLRLAKIRKQLPAELVTTYLDYKDAAKRAGTYGTNFLKHVWADGRIHTYFHQAITSTGRLSSEPNLQNLPRDARYRKCFIPKPGNVFLIADYSQIEPRLSAQVSDDPVYVQTFLDGADIYVRCGEAMSGQTIDKNTDQGAMMRQIFKALALALAYNMGPGKLRNALTLALEDYIERGEIELPSYAFARELHEKFFKVHTGIKTYQDQCIRNADPENPARPKLYDRYLNAGVTWVAGPCGRKRFFAPDCKTVYTESPNAPIQGCSATITKLATVQIMLRAEELGIECHMVNSVHDEIILEVAKADAEVMVGVLKAEMEAAASRYITRVPVQAEFPKNTNGIVECWLKEG